MKDKIEELVVGLGFVSIIGLSLIFNDCINTKKLKERGERIENPYEISRDIGKNLDCYFNTKYLEKKIF